MADFDGGAMVLMVATGLAQNPAQFPKLPSPFPLNPKPGPIAEMAHPIFPKPDPLKLGVTRNSFSKNLFNSSVELYHPRKFFGGSIRKINGLKKPLELKVLKSLEYCKYTY